jgi:hypothetical protein
LPPAYTEDLVKIFQKGVYGHHENPEFLADKKKYQLNIDPVSPEEAEKTAARFFKLDTALVAKLREI